MNAVRLCFQVFLESTDPERPGFTVPLTPVVSDPIYDKKAMSDLVICKLSKPSCTVAGGEELILLCEKVRRKNHAIITHMKYSLTRMFNSFSLLFQVAKEDISIRFFEESHGIVTWEGFGDFQHTNVHKQVAISFRTPKYRTLDIEQPVKVIFCDMILILTGFYSIHSNFN